MSDKITIWKLCAEGFRRNRIPALILQGVAGVLLASYFLVPAFRPGFDAVADLKQRTDPWFAMVSTGLFAGLIPWAVSYYRGRIPRHRWVPHLLAMVVYWTLTGALIDFVYTLQDRVFGSGRDFQTLALKTLVDQGPYNLLWATPTCLIFYGWKEADFSWSRFKATHPWPVIKQKYVLIQVSCWIVWIPAVMMIYAMPLALQIPLFSLVICFFSILLMFLNR